MVAYPSDVQAIISYKYKTCGKFYFEVKAIVSCRYC